MLPVVDVSHPDRDGQLAAVREVLTQVRAAGVPALVALKISDPAGAETVARLRGREPHGVLVSACTGEGVDALGGGHRRAAAARHRCGRGRPA